MSIEKSFSRVTIHDFIDNIKALRDRKVVTVPSTATVKETLDLLTSHNHLSCPVKATDSGEWLGFVDMMDILSWIVQEFSQDNSVQVPGRGEVHWKTWCQNKDHLLVKGKDLSTVETESIINWSKCDPFCPVEDNGNVFQLVETLANVHRVAVRDSHEEVTHIVTQSAIIMFLRANMNVVGDLANKTLKELGLVETNVICMSEKAEAIIGFHAIRDNRVGGIAIVDKNGEYVTTLSVSDLKGLSVDSFPQLLLPCKDYVSERNQGQLPPAVFCSFDTKFGEAIDLLATHHIHRLWVLDEQRHPIAVVTLSTIIRMLATS